MIYRAPFFLPWLYPTLTWKVATEKKELYLTFDDGPVPGPTDFVLDVLEKFSIKATFFCIGDNVRKHPAIFRRILSHGHAVGNHTYHHVKGWSTSLEKYVENVEHCQAEFRVSSPESPASTLFRPPYGRITRSQIKALSGYKIIMWDVLTNDYDKAKSGATCLKNSIEVTQPGSIIVFHDSLKAERNMSYVLPRYVEHFMNLGYDFNVLS